MGNRTIEELEERQEDSRGALSRGAWLYVERATEGAFTIETCVLPNAADVRAALEPLGFRYAPKTGRFWARVPAGDVALRRVGAVLLPLLAGELP